MNSQYTKMIEGKPYRSDDPELVAARLNAQQRLREFNLMAGDRKFERSAIIRQLFGSTRCEFNIESNFQADYGFNIFIGENFYVNFNCIMLDCAPIRFGDNVKIGPNASFYTATHPLDPEERNSGFESAKPITIGHNVWIGGSAVILPGVTLGNNVVVGAGAVR